MAISWKSFDFFDVTRVPLPDDETKELFESNDISSVCAGSDSLFLGAQDGTVSIVGKSWKVVRAFQAYDAGSVTQMRQVEGTSLLVTVAEDMIHDPVLKVWALDKLNKKTNMPTCLSTLNINNARRQFPITAFTATEDLSQIAVGFGNGSVVLIRGDVVHDLGTKQRIVFESEEPVTGVQLIVEERLTTVFVSNTSRVLKVAIAKNGRGQPPKVVEDIGCGLGLMTQDERNGDVLVARDDAIYSYTLEGRGAPKAYDAPKRMIYTHNQYVALSCLPSSAARREQATMRRRFGGGPNDPIFAASTFVMLEPGLRLIAHTETMIAPVKYIFDLWGDLFTISEDGKVHRYHERALQQRLEMLYQRNMFPLAIELAQSSGLDTQQQSLIYRKYGDHLYSKAEFDSAMVQYIRAIETTEPSQVIRKFLDSQRIHNLILYLEQLHERRKATADHTTLLLNCYAKLKDIGKLEKFIKQPGDLKFDLDTAIVMCRQGGYYEQAAYLAKKHGETELVVDILVEDAKQYPEALAFIWGQEPDVVLPSLQKYARVLIEHCPSDATVLFIDFYTGKYIPRKSKPVDDEVQVDADTSLLPSAGYIANTAATAIQNFLPYMPSPGTGTGTGTPLATSDTPGKGKPAAAEGTSAQDDGYFPPPVYDPPPPRTAFSSFIDHPDEFITFLEACLNEKDVKKTDRTDLYTALFEMYLYKSSQKRGQHNKEEWEAKAKTLIEGSNVPMESSNVLLLSHLSDFRDGTVLVKEQAGLLFDIFRSYTAAKDTRGAIKALKKYGPNEKQLYPAALAYFTSDPAILEEAGQDELTDVLDKIDKDGLMTSLQVIQTLAGQTSGSGVATVGMIKPYLYKRIERERDEILSNRQRINGYRTDTDKRRAELQDLGSKPAVFQATRCSDCSQGLDLPAVHFLCKHSFHQRCLRQGIDGEIECPKCSGDNDVIRKMREGQVAHAERHDIFKTDLENSGDRFAKIAEWFARGVIDVGTARE